MVNEKQSTTRSGILGILVRKFFMDVIHSPGLLACCIFPALFLLVCRFVIEDPFGPEDTHLFLLTFGMLFSTGMVPGTTIIYPMSEAREKHTLRTLTLAGIDHNQMIVARGIVSTLYITLVSMTCFLISGVAFESMLPFILITVLASIPLTALSLILGLISHNQMAASLYSLPVILIGMAPFIFPYVEAAFSILPFLPTGGGFALAYALAEGTLFTSASIVPALAQLAWIIVSVIALIVIAPRIPRDPLSS